MRNHWSNRFGFILAAVGSAVGLGNIWKFPYITGMNGGGAFVLIYLLAIVICGLPILMAEFLLGRESQKDVVGTFKQLGKGPFWSNIGWMGIVGAFIILSYYSVVAGWTLDYLVKSLTGTFTGRPADEIAGMFGALVSNGSEQMIYHTFFIILTILAVVSGVKEGIERWNRVLMPSLFVLIFIMFVYAMTTDGAMAGIKFMFYPDFTKLTSGAILEAIGHSFFTLSLGMGAMITYASYMDRSENIVGTATRVAFLDTLVAIIAGLAMFPIVFSVGLEPAAGPGLIFKTLPQVFSSIAGGQILAIIFFILLAFAALSSAISLLEVLTAYLIDEKGMGRKRATILMGVLAYVMGIPSALSYNVMSDVTIAGMPVLDFLDYIASNYLLPLGGMLIAIFCGYFLDKKLSEGQIVEEGTSYTVFKVWFFVIRYIAPVAVFIVFLTKIGVIG